MFDCDIIGLVSVVAVFAVRRDIELNNKFNFVGGVTWGRATALI